MPKEYNSVSIGGYVPQRIPVRSNIEAFTNALNKIDARADEVAKQATAIDVALAQADLNEKENAWKAKKSQQIKDELLSNPYDDISSNWRRAQTLAADVTKELMPRVKYQQEYKKEAEQVQNRTDISDLTKQRWAAQNQYSYQDQFDNDGNWIGGNDWKANWKPVTRRDPKNLIVLAGQLAAPEKKSTSTQSSSSVSDERGISGGAKSGSGSSLLAQSSSSSKSFSYEKLTKEKLDTIYGALFELDPDAANSIQQDFLDIEWKIKDLDKEISTTTDPDKANALRATKAAYKKEIWDEGNRRYLKPNEYMLNKVGAITGGMAYYNTNSATASSSSVSYGETADEKARKAAKASQDFLDGLAEIPTLNGNVKSSPGTTSISMPSIFQLALKGMDGNTGELDNLHMFSK